MPTLDILIPTYNRAEDLGENLRRLQAQAQALGAEAGLVRVCVSDNASTDGTAALLQSLSEGQLAPLSLVYERHTENRGLEANAVHVLSMAQAPYVLFLGDDDFLAEGYLAFVLEQIQSPEPPSCIITGILQIDNAWQVIGDPRPADFELAEEPGGKEAIIRFSHLAHQMSGLVLRREGLLDSYLANPQWRNPYLFIYFAAECLRQGKGIYAAKYKTLVKILNQKDWGYNDMGLLDEVYKSYYPFLAHFEAEVVAAFILRFTVMHSYRFGMKRSAPLRLYRQYVQLCEGLPQALQAPLGQGLSWVLLKEYIRLWIKR